MVYSFELIKHANIRYREPIRNLSRFELDIMLRSLGIFTGIVVESVGNTCFLTFECRELSGPELVFLASHSSVVFMAEKIDGLLRPLPVVPSFYLGEDLPEVLKYKGKTGVTFTRMMLNVALCLSPFRKSEGIPLLFDPLCGKGTSCFCALVAGMNAVGLDVDRKDIREASDYFSRYLRYHKLKHDTVLRSETAGSHPVPVTEFRFADTKEHYKGGDMRTLALACADSALSPSLFRSRKAHIIVSDFPYGVQHATQSGSRPEPLVSFLLRVLPQWKKALVRGGVAALSFNTLTLPADRVREAFTQSGYSLPEDSSFLSLEHEVEQAVVRNVVFALNTEEVS